jgi:hypothetical protein
MYRGTGNVCTFVGTVDPYYEAIMEEINDND